MPVRRFRSVEDMNRPRWRSAGDPDLFRAMAGLWSLGRQTLGPRFPPGVYRHRSIEDLDAQNERWQEDAFRNYHARRGKAPPA